MNPPLIFDVHLDLAWNAIEFNRDQRWSQERLRRREIGLTDNPGRSRSTVCFPEMRRGRVGLCVATQLARYVPYFGRLPGFASPEQAWAETQGQLAWYREMEAAGEMVQIRDRGQLEAHLNLWQGSLGASRAMASGSELESLPIGYILSLEGADSIVTMKHLERAHADGLRAVGPVHYGPGIYGHGTDDEGPLTPRGHELLREMERLGIILDVTHLCDESFWDALRRFQGRVWASHSNCRSLAHWNRQFNDEQIKALIERGAVLGMALDAIMMVHGWAHHRSKPQDFGLTLAKICEHIDHICQLAGNPRHVGIGTDLDGGYGTEQTPQDVDSIADVAKLAGLLSSRGYSTADIEGIFHGNFLRFLREAWV
jgi:membrane dipeptidase